MAFYKVILVTYPDDFTLNEARNLVETLSENKIIAVFTQRYLNRARYGMGAGKAEEIGRFIKEDKNVDKIIVDEHLTAKQVYNIEQITGVQVIDRERLILDIFYSRATTMEAKLQIQLAEIQYEMPRVREKAKMMSKSNERPGKGGMGEYIVDVQFRDLKRQMSFIKDKIKEAQSKRQNYQQQREKTGMPVVSLVGYTSSGKTTLFNLLTKEHKETSSNLFTTLSTTTRSLKRSNANPNDKKDNILVIDTVGFISRLPHYMVEAFKSTLEESINANLILLLIDCSEEMQNVKIKYNTCCQVLEELQVDKTKVHTIFTKVDEVHSHSIEEIKEYLEIKSNVLTISSKSGYGIHKLQSFIFKKCEEGIDVTS